MKGAILVIMPMSLASASCGGMVVPEATGPLHCAAQMEGYAIIAKMQGNEKLSKGFEARSQWFSQRARALPPAERTPEIIRAISEKIAAAPDGGEALATACMERQNADADFKRYARQN